MLLEEKILFAFRQITVLIEDATAPPFLTAKSYFDASMDYAEFPYLRICNANRFNKTRVEELGLDAPALGALTSLHSNGDVQSLSDVIEALYDNTLLR